MIPLLAFSATIQFECADVANIMENVEKVRIVNLSEEQKKEVMEALASFVPEECPVID